MATALPRNTFENQVNDDQCKYSRYVCDSRAIPQEIDGLKPVQRRILWTMWNSNARNHFTKTVKVAGLTMGYHPHGDRSITDAIAAMTQEFPFSNNFALVQGEGTFGDILDPNAIASPRYTEVRLSPFAKDVGLFESLEDIEYIPNYDETDKEPIFFCAKIPLVLINPIQGIATGFRCNIPAFRLKDVIDSLNGFLKSGRVKKLTPWYKNYSGTIAYEKKEQKTMTVTTEFVFSIEGTKVFLTGAPQYWNREKVIRLLDKILDTKGWLRGYNDYSRDDFRIELHLKKGIKPIPSNFEGLTDVTSTDVTAFNMITIQGKLDEFLPEEVIRRFAAFRKKHLITRFKRLAGIEKEKIERYSELIRFIKEQWNQKVLTVKSKAALEDQLKKAKFKFIEFLASLPIYRLTKDEVDKCNASIALSQNMLSYYNGLVKTDSKLTAFMINELRALKEKWDA